MHAHWVETPPFMPREQLAEVEVMGWIGQALPESFASVSHLDHHRSSPGYVFHWFTSRPFLDHTGLQLAGPGGVRLGLFLILRMLLFVCMKRNEIQPPENLPLTTISLFIERCVTALTDQIENSIALLQDKSRWVRGQPIGCATHILKEPASKSPVRSFPSSHT